MSALAPRLPAAAELALRRLTLQDRPALLAMYKSFVPKAACMGLPPRADQDRWLDSLAPYPNFIVVDGLRIAGHAALCPDGMMNGEGGEVAVFVHQDYRGCGLGRRLLTELIAEARRLGLRRIWGTTEWDNVPMLRLARSLGFVSDDDPREFYLILK